MENDIYKNRSISACIKTSFDVLTINFATIFKKTWLGSLAWAICLTALVFFFGKFALTVTANEPSVWTTAIPTLCALQARSQTCFPKSIYYDYLIDSSLFGCSYPCPGSFKRPCTLTVRKQTAIPYPSCYCRVRVIWPDYFSHPRIHATAWI